LQAVILTPLISKNNIPSYQIKMAIQWDSNSNLNGQKKNKKTQCKQLL